MLQGNIEMCEGTGGQMEDDVCFDLTLEGPSLEHDYLSLNDPMLTSSLPKVFDADARLHPVIDDVTSADVPQFVNSQDEDPSCTTVFPCNTIQQKWSATVLPARKKATIVKCEYCGVILKHPSKIEAHKRTHTGEKPFQCQICGSRFTQRTPMRMHVRRHMGLLPYVCGWGCGKRFVSNALKNAHELKTHMGAKRRGPPRPHLKPPKRLAPLEMVARDEAGTDVPSCQAPLSMPSPSSPVIASEKINEVVEEVAVEDSISLEHKCRRQRKKALITQCSECGLLLKHPSKIQAHMRTHTGERPFECGLCGMRFATANPLRVHFRRLHTGEKPYECSWECGRRFVSISARNEHERIVHAGIRRYRCSINNCFRTFTRRRYLVMHQAKVHKDVTEQADNAIQCVLDMVKQERDSRQSYVWLSEKNCRSGDYAEKIWPENKAATGEQIEEQYVDNSSEISNGLPECAAASVIGFTYVKEEDGPLFDESCQQIVIDETDEDIMSTNFEAEPREMYNLDQDDDIQFVDNAPSDGDQFVSEYVPSVIPGITVKASNPELYQLCQESATILPKYGRIRIIKPIKKNFNREVL